MWKVSVNVCNIFLETVGDAIVLVLATVVITQTGVPTSFMRANPKLVSRFLGFLAKITSILENENSNADLSEHISSPVNVVNNS